MNTWQRLEAGIIIAAIAGSLWGQMSPAGAIAQARRLEADRPKSQVQQSTTTFTGFSLPTGAVYRVDTNGRLTRDDVEVTTLVGMRQAMRSLAAAINRSYPPRSTSVSAIQWQEEK
jgi:hypothetical protein